MAYSSIRARALGYSQFGQFQVNCADANCGRTTTKKFARAHNGLCKACTLPESVNRPPSFDAEVRAENGEQHARYIDCGPQAWDDRS